MAKTIRAQLALQLPEATAAENLAFLEAVFAAIRAGDPAPDGGPGVYPALVKLGRSLMAKESLGFVRATLDLEPLALAQRVALPCALAWGDKDVQTWKPERLPEGFPHPVLTLKDANHLLKREPRPRAELNGATAVAGYGDGAAMADLAPLAAWLKTLK